jgi:hypothetical protein
MRRIVTAAAALVLTLSFLAPPAGADQMGWHSEAPIGPLGVPARVGTGIGDIEFWAPNRGVLITDGINGVSPAGIYAYDGVEWHLYSTVCGGSEGRIAWAGPDEFWTISSYASPQQGSGGEVFEQGLTLCRFRNGEVAESFAEPFGSPAQFRQMKAAACSGPSDCWFAGKPVTASAANPGPFHLHWDGADLKAVPSLVEPQPEIENPPGEITDLNFLDGSLFEAASEAPYLRQIDLADPAVFRPVPLPEGAPGHFELAGDAGQLWAIGPTETVAEEPTVLRNIGTGFEEIHLAEALEPEFDIHAVGSEPNSAAVWVGGVEVVSGQLVAKLKRISANGSISEPVLLPAAGEELTGMGQAEQISCPAAGQCWMASANGWLFHRGGPLPRDTDPAMHTLITTRPKDGSTSSFVSAGLPEDNSGETEPGRSLGGEELLPFPESRPHRNVVYDVHRKLLGNRTLELSFKLRAPAHVQLIAKFHRKVAAKTPRLTLGKGLHKVHLKLDPKRWPTGLDFQVHPIEKKKT